MSQTNFTPLQPKPTPLPPELQAVFDRLVFIGRAMSEEMPANDKTLAFAPQGENQSGGES